MGGTLGHVVQTLQEPGSNYKLLLEVVYVSRALLEVLSVFARIMFVSAVSIEPGKHMVSAVHASQLDARLSDHVSMDLVCPEAVVHSYVLQSSTPLPQALVSRAC